MRGSKPAVRVDRASTLPRTAGKPYRARERRPPGVTARVRSHLARHGEPALSRQVRLIVPGISRRSWARYELMGLLPGQTPPAALSSFVETCDVLVASTRLRAIESAQTVGQGRAFTQEPLLIEAPLPPPNWPAWVRLSPRIWGLHRADSTGGTSITTKARRAESRPNCAPTRPPASSTPWLPAARTWWCWRTASSTSWSGARCAGAAGA